MGIWNQVRQVAAGTPPERNRYVDFLRAVSISVVIIGHWLIATFQFTDGSLAGGHLLKSHPQYQWLTWVFQVMPIFFIVGGYSNAVSLDSAQRKGVSYGDWLAGRLNRLVTPLLMLIVSWAVLSVVLVLFGTSPETIQFGSQAALIPTWFLAIYIMVVILAPVTFRLWRATGFVSFWAFAGVAAAVDYAFFALDMRWLGWSNYFWVWLAVHHLGYAWRDGRFGSPLLLLAWSAAGFATLALLIFKGPYPLAMVGSPDEGLSNTLPPKVTLLALGICQFGLLVSLEKPMRRVLENLQLWAATVLVNTMIMTVYLWHITVMIIFVALLYLAGGPGLGLEPGTTAWWWSRIPWIGVLLALLIPVALVVSPLERQARGGESRVPAPARQIAGAMLLCLGIALLAMYGYGGGPLPRLDLVSFGLVVAGAALSGLLPGLPGHQRA